MRNLLEAMKRDYPICFDKADLDQDRESAAGEGNVSRELHDLTDLVLVSLSLIGDNSSLVSACFNELITGHCKTTHYAM